MTCNDVFDDDSSSITMIAVALLGLDRSDHKIIYVVAPDRYAGLVLYISGVYTAIYFRS